MICIVHLAFDEKKLLNEIVHDQNCSQKYQNCISCFNAFSLPLLITRWTKKDPNHMYIWIFKFVTYPLGYLSIRFLLIILFILKNLPYRWKETACNINFKPCHILQWMKCHLWDWQVLHGHVKTFTLERQALKGTMGTGWNQKIDSNWKCVIISH